MAAVLWNYVIIYDVTYVNETALYIQLQHNYHSQVHPHINFIIRLYAVPSPYNQLLSSICCLWSGH